MKILSIFKDKPIISEQKKPVLHSKYIDISLLPPETLKEVKIALGLPLF